MTIKSNLQEPLLERLSATPKAENLEAPKKRKLDDTGPNAKKAAKRSKRKQTRAVEDGLDIGAGLNKAFSHMDSQLLADYMAQCTRKHESDLSTIELEDKFIPGV